MADGFEDVCTLYQIPDGGVRMVEAGGRDVLLSRFGKDVFAVGGHCTHAMASLADARVDGDVLTCSHHGARFDRRTGRSLSGSCPNLPVYAVRVVGAVVEVKVRG